MACANSAVASLAPAPCSAPFWPQFFAESFGLLVASSQTTDRKLPDVAGHLVITGDLLTPSQ